MKKTIFGVILAAFLVMSVSWIAPIHVKASGINDLFEMAKDMAEDEDFLALLDSNTLKSVLQEIEDRDLSEIEEMIEDCKNGQDQEFKEIFVDPITNTEEFQRLSGRYDLSQVEEQMRKYTDIGTSEQNSDNYLFFIKNDALKIKKQDENTLTEKDQVLVGNELVKFSYEDDQGNLVVTNGWEDLTLVQKIIVVCLGAAAVIVGGIALLYGLSLLLGFLVTLITALTSLIGTLITILIVVVVVLVAVAFVAPFLEELWDILQKLLEDIKTRFENNEETPTEENTRVKYPLLKKTKGFVYQLFAFLKAKLQLA